MNQIIQTHTQGPQLKSHMRLSVLGLFLVLIGQLLVVGCGGSDDDGDTVGPQDTGNNPPQIISASASSNAVSVGDTVTLSVTATDTEDTNLTYSWIEGTETVEIVNAGTPTATADFTGVAADTYTFVISVTDSKGISATSTVTVVVSPATDNNHAPTVQIDESTVTSVAVGVEVALTAVAADEDEGDSLTYSWTASTPGSVNFLASDSLATTATFSAIGEYDLTITVTDLFGEFASDVITITVGSVVVDNEAPVITAIVGDQQNYTLEAGATTANVVLRADVDDINDDEISYSWEVVGGPDGAEDSVAVENPNGRFIEIDLPLGQYTFTVTVTEVGAEGLTAQKTQKINVKPAGPNNDPVINSVTTDAVYAKVGDSITLSIDADDPDNDVLTYFWSSTGGDYNGDVTFKPGDQEGDVIATFNDVRRRADGSVNKYYNLAWTVWDGSPDDELGNPAGAVNSPEPLTFKVDAAPTESAVWFTSHWTGQAVAPGELTLKADAWFPAEATISQIALYQYDETNPVNDGLTELDVDTEAPYTFTVNIPDNNVITFRAVADSSDGQNTGVNISLNWVPTAAAAAAE